MQRHKPIRTRQRKSTSLFSGFGLTGLAIVCLLGVIAVFVGSLWITPRKVHTIERPLSTAVIQVLNGCGENGAAGKLADALMPGDSVQLYDIIEKGDAKLATFDRTTVVDRRGSESQRGVISKKALGVARRLGIDPSEIIILKLDDNILNIDVTVIAGRDYGQYVNKLKEAREHSASMGFPGSNRREASS
jgi:LytR cell envelope-related transcriptional attenuator